jgi:hypothetical protein
MTKLIQHEHTCLVCGGTNAYAHIGYTNQIGFYDLDTRPPERLRSTLPYWVQRCPQCGYCAPQVSQGPECVHEIVESSAYQAQLSDRFYPPLANHFLAWALILEHCNDLIDAGWACVHAAWACDDAEAGIGANLSRLRAVELFKRARRNGTGFFSEPGGEDAVLADLLRRSGEFEPAVTAVQVGVLKRPVEIIRRMLYYQVALVMERDIAAHTIQEAAQNPRYPGR